MKKIILILSIISIAILSSCDENELLNYDGGNDISLVGFTNKSSDLKVAENDTETLEIEVNISDKSSSDRTIDVMINTDLSSALSANYMIPSSVTIPANSNFGTLTVTGYDDANIDALGEHVLITLVPTDKIKVTESFKNHLIQIKEFCPPNNSLILKINFDHWASETSWELRDQSNTILYSGSGYSDGETPLETELCVVDGTYTFEIFDAYGDGMVASSGTGDYELKFGDTILASGGGVIGDCSTSAPWNPGCSEATTFTK